MQEFNLTIKISADESYSERVSEGTRFLDLAEKYQKYYKDQIVLVMHDHRLRELNKTVKKDMEISVNITEARSLESVSEYLEATKRDARENGFVRTMFGRIRHVPEINAGNKNLQAFGERVAMNTPIQGAAADLIKIAMIRTDKMLREAGLKARLI